MTPREFRLYVKLVGSWFLIMLFCVVVWVVLAHFALKLLWP